MRAAGQTIMAAIRMSHTVEKERTRNTSQEKTDYERDTFDLHVDDAKTVRLARRAAQCSFGEGRNVFHYLLSAKQPHCVIEELLTSLPNATLLMGTGDAEGIRPLHTAFMNNASEDTLVALVAARPDAARLDFGDGTEDTNGDGIRDGTAELEKGDLVRLAETVDPDDLLVFRGHTGRWAGLMGMYCLDRERGLINGKRVWRYQGTFRGVSGWYLFYAGDEAARWCVVCTIF